MSGPVNFTTAVRDQYEWLPFPARNPEDERRFLIIPPADILGKVNQYCFGGSQDFGDGFRVLVAGAGTGDSVIYLAEQLRSRGGHVTYLDMSSASMKVAQQRAAIRNLTNIRWINASILDLARLKVGKFDYISCMGVLHHLPDPDSGLAVLVSKLAKGGGMALMLYGVHGRAHTYQMQKVMKRIISGDSPPEAQLKLAKEILKGLPPTNLFRAREGSGRVQSEYLGDEANLWDDLLSAQDRAYEVDELYEFLARAGLSLINFGTYQGINATCRLQYDINFFVHDPHSREYLAGRPLAERQSIADALDGSLSLHTVYAAVRSGTALAPHAPDTILSVLTGVGRQAIDHLQAGADSVKVVLRNEIVVTYRPGPSTVAFLASIDGRRTNQELKSSLAAKGIEVDFAQLASLLDIPAAWHWIVGRTRSGMPVQTIPMESQPMSLIRHSEPVKLVCPL